MSVSITATPKALSWSRNNGKFVLTRTDILFRTNYCIGCYFEVSYGFSNNRHTNQSAEMIFTPVDGKVEIPLRIIDGYFPEPELPGIDSDFTSFDTLLSTVLEYKLHYYEIYGSPMEAQPEAQSETLYMLPGQMVNITADLDIPDWKSNQPNDCLSSLTTPFVVGSDTGRIEFIHRSQPQYLYIYSPVSSSATVTIELKKITSAGDEITNSFNLTFTQHNIKRVNIGAQQMAGNVMSYTFRVVSENNIELWSRNYTIIPDSYNQQLYLTMDRYGLMRTFVAHDYAEKPSMDGNQITKDLLTSIDITDCHTSFECFTDALPPSRLRLISQALTGRYTYLYNMGVWRRIIVQPGEITTSDTRSDMLQLSLSYRFASGEAHPLPSIDTDYIIQNTILPIGQATIGSTLILD